MIWNNVTCVRVLPLNTFDYPKHHGCESFSRITSRLLRIIKSILCFTRLWYAMTNRWFSTSTAIGGSDATQSCFLTEARNHVRQFTDQLSGSDYWFTHHQSIITACYYNEHRRSTSYFPFCYVSFWSLPPSYITQTPPRWWHPGSVNRHFPWKRRNSKKKLHVLSTDIFGTFWYHDDFWAPKKVSPDSRWDRNFGAW